MADERIKDLATSLTSPVGTEFLPSDAASGGTRKLALSDLRGWVLRPTIHNVVFADSPYTVPDGPRVLVLADCTNGGIAVVLSNTAQDGDEVIVKDTSAGGLSHAPPTFSVVGGGNIDGGASFPAISSFNIYQAWTFMYSVAAGQWLVVAAYSGTRSLGGGG